MRKEGGGKKEQGRRRRRGEGVMENGREERKGQGSEIKEESI